VDGLGKAISAILGGLGDVFFGRLTLLALLNFIIAAALTAAAAWALIKYLVPLIPDGSGWVFTLSAAGEFAASIAVVVLVIALSPAISMVVGGVLFFDIAAARVEKRIGAPQTRNVPLGEALWNNARIALPALVLNVVVIPLYFIPVVNAIVFWTLNGFLMGREYATVVAARRMSYREAVALRKRNGLSIFLVGLACSFIPFFAPLVGASAMTRLVNALR
jgi:CysZ protein